MRTSRPGGSGWGSPGMIDVHVHFMPERVMDAVWALLRQRRRSTTAATGRCTTSCPRPSGSSCCASSACAASPRCCTRTSPAWPSRCRRGRGEFAARTPGCVPTGTFYPEPSAARYVREAVEAGTAVFKVHVQVGAFDPRDELLEPVWGLLAEAGTPVVVHCGSGPDRRRAHRPGAVRRGARRAPAADRRHRAHGGAGVRRARRAGAALLRTCTWTPRWSAPRS